MSHSRKSDSRSRNLAWNPGAALGILSVPAQTFQGVGRTWRMLGTVSSLDRCLWRLGILDPTSPLRVNVRILTGIVGFHLLALLACVPWLFSWSGLDWAVGGLYL